MQVSQIRHFIAVAETLNFHRAAERVHLSQQAISKSISQLEQRLGFRLLERGRQAVRLTERGQELLPHAYDMVAAVRRFEAAVSSHSDSDTGSMAIGATPTFLSSILPNALARFQACFPETPVTVERGDFSSLCAAMTRGDLDLILSTAPADIPRNLVKAVVIGQDRNVIVVRTGHPLASLRPVRCEDLLRYPQLRTLNYTRGATFVGRLFAAADVPVPRPMLDVGSTLLGIERVEHSDFWWSVPQLLVRHRIEKGDFSVLETEIEDEHWDLIMATRRHAVVSKWIIQFQAIVQACLAGSPADHTDNHWMS